MKVLLAGIKSKEFWIGVSLYFAFAIITFNINSRYDDLQGQQLTSNDFFYYSAMLLNTAASIAFPVFAILGSSRLIFESGGEAKASILNYNRKIFKSAIVGALVILSAQGMLLILSIFYSGNLNHIYIYGAFSDFFNTPMTSIILIFIINSVCVAFIYTLFSAILAYKEKNKLNAIILPILLYSISIFIPFQDFPVLQKFIPQISYDLIGKELSFESHIWGLGVTLAIVLLSYIIKVVNIKKVEIKE